MKPNPKHAGLLPDFSLRIQAALRDKSNFHIGKEHFYPQVYAIVVQQGSSLCQLFDPL